MMMRTICLVEELQGKPGPPTQDRIQNVAQLKQIHMQVKHVHIIKYSA